METTATRLWKRLTREERLDAAQHFFREPPQELLGSAYGAIVKVRHVRPQVARTLPVDEQAKTLAAVSDLGEPLAASLLVALHLGSRRQLLSAFLDALGLPHENGLLKEDDDGSPIDREAAQKGIAAIAGAFPRPWVDLYLNVLWLQDTTRWAALKDGASWA